MAIAVSLQVTPSSPNHGDTVTATYVVTGNDGSPAQTQQVVGDVTIAAQTFHVATSITLPGTAAQPVQYSVPTCPGLTFAVTANPAVFTALVP